MWGGGTSVSAEDTTASLSALSASSVPLTAAHYNSSGPPGCIEVIFDSPVRIAGEEVEATTRHVKDFLLALLFLMGGPANLINMAVFFRQGLRDRVNLCLFSLSLADELYLTMAMFLHGEQLHLQFTTQERFGPMATFMINNHVTVLGGFCYVSPVLSAIIAVERCICVLSPLKFHTLFRTRTMAVLIVVVTLLMLATQTIVAFRYHIGCLYDPLTGKVLNTMVDGEFYKAHRDLVNKLDGFVFGSGLPLVVITVVTIATVITGVKLHRIVTWRSGTSSSISPKEVALTRMLVGNSILFIACVFPTAAIRFVWLFLSGVTSGQENQMFFMASLWVAELFTFVNASLNIFVYYSMGSRYRETFWALFGRKPPAPKKLERASAQPQPVQ
ncbi:uncharacterized protein LOC143275804 [Babylonia areolata]|uniref:uncharacterized protein LOC143275804 n=1 Tax=Babylonia areolata TaxID=304850 RepID=UPI003FD64CDD